MRGSSAHNRYVLAQILSKWGGSRFAISFELQGVTVGINHCDSPSSCAPDRLTVKACEGRISDAHGATTMRATDRDGLFQPSNFHQKK